MESFEKGSLGNAAERGCRAGLERRAVEIERTEQESVEGEATEFASVGDGKSEPPVQLQHELASRPGCKRGGAVY